VFELPCAFIGDLGNTVCGKARLLFELPCAFVNDLGNTVCGKARLMFELTHRSFTKAQHICGVNPRCLRTGDMGGNSLFPSIPGARAASADPGTAYEAGLLGG